MTRTAAMLVILAGLMGCASPDEGTDMSHQGFMLRPASGMKSSAACAANPKGFQQAPQAYQQASAATATPGRPGPPQYLPPPGFGTPAGPTPIAGQAARPTDNSPSAAAPALPQAPNSAVPAGGIALTAGSSPAAETDASRYTVASVNSRRIALNYELKDGGQGGDPQIDLWFTHDGKPWELYQGPPSHQPPFIVEVKEEGRYGFALVARTAAGASRPPQASDPPQVQVEVDVTSPVVQLLGVQPDPNPENHAVTVLWQASDKNLGPQPITLSWAREAAGPWFPITSQLENSGRYVWRLPTALPPRVWLRVEAADLAGNVGMAGLPEAIFVDQSTSNNASVLSINSLQKPTPALPGRIPVVGVEPAPEPPVRAGISSVEFIDK
jgi:hypothetical protein